MRPEVTHSIYIITGTTRGIGRALAQAVITRGGMLFSISRAPARREKRWHNYTCDLRHPGQIRNTMVQLMAAAGSCEPCDDLILINNAGVLQPIGPLEHAPDDGIEQHLAVNLQAPLLLSAHFIRASAQFGARRRIINISSGAGERAYAGWSLYCAAKAALNMLTACVALEQYGREQPVSICAVSPGVVETDMQRAIRQTSAADFPARERFEQLHARGQLEPPEHAARLILELDAAGLMTSGGFYDLRDVQNLPGGGLGIQRRN
jgi:benzil reductase ((S)-benzoin forming)